MKQRIEDPDGDRGARIEDGGWRIEELKIET
jgi:hypothetical protein